MSRSGRKSLPYSCQAMRIRIKVICFFNLMRIRSRGFTWMKIGSDFCLTLMWNRSPDPASHQSDANRDHWNTEYKPSTAPYCNYLYASNVSVHGLPWLHFWICTAHEFWLLFSSWSPFAFDGHSEPEPASHWCWSGSDFQVNSDPQHYVDASNKLPTF